MKTYMVKYKITSKNDNKFIVLSDFHSYFSKTLANYISSIKSNYIIIAGDVFNGDKWNSNKWVNKFKDFIDIISENHIVIISLGNHDLFTISKKGFNNFRSLKSKNVYPLFNESISFKDVCFTSFVPSKKYYSYFEQDRKKVINGIIREYNNLDKSINKRKINILVSHNPYHFYHSEVSSLINKDFDFIITGHFHDGWIPTKFLDNNYDKILDNGLHEAINDIVFRNDPYTISVNPKRILSRGMARIDENGYFTMLPNNKIYYFDRNSNSYTKSNKEEYMNSKTASLVISGAVNTFLKLKCFYPHITILETKKDKNILIANRKINK